MQTKSWALGFVFGIATLASAGTVPVTTCGQFVGSGDVGVLQADLLCPPSGVGVSLDPNAGLQLNGHRISGAMIGVYTHAGRTDIQGPGVIRDAVEVGVYAPNNEGRHTVRIHGDVDLKGHGISAISLGQSNKVNLQLTDVHIEDNPGTTLGQCNGIKLRAANVEVLRNGGGICGDAIRLDRVDIQDNQGAGIFSWRATARLRDTIVTGHTPYDIETTRRPRLMGSSSCGLSVQLPPFPDFPAPGAPSWSVCSGD